MTQTADNAAGTEPATTRCFEAALAQTRTVREGKVPRTEMLVVLKSLAAVSPVRNRRKGAFL